MMQADVSICPHLTIYFTVTHYKYQGHTPVQQVRALVKWIKENKYIPKCGSYTGGGLITKIINLKERLTLGDQSMVSVIRLS